MSSSSVIPFSASKRQPDDQRANVFCVLRFVQTRIPQWFVGGEDWNNIWLFPPWAQRLVNDASKGGDLIVVTESSWKTAGVPLSFVFLIDTDDRVRPPAYILIGLLAGECKAEDLQATMDTVIQRSCTIAHEDTVEATAALHMAFGSGHDFDWITQSFVDNTNNPLLRCIFTLLPLSRLVVLNFPVVDIYHALDTGLQLWSSDVIRPQEEDIVTGQLSYHGFLCGKQLVVMNASKLSCSCNVVRPPLLCAHTWAVRIFVVLGSSSAFRPWTEPSQETSDDAEASRPYAGIISVRDVTPLEKCEPPRQELIDSLVQAAKSCEPKSIKARLEKSDLWTTSRVPFVTAKLNNDIWSWQTIEDVSQHANWGHIREELDFAFPGESAWWSGSLVQMATTYLPSLFRRLRVDLGGSEAEIFHMGMVKDDALIVNAFGPSFNTQNVPPFARLPERWMTQNTLMTLGVTQHFITLAVLGPQKVVAWFDGHNGSYDPAGMIEQFQLRFAERLVWEVEQGHMTENEAHQWLVGINNVDFRREFNFPKQSDGVSCGPICVAATLCLAQGILPTAQRLGLDGSFVNKSRGSILARSILTLLLTLCIDKNAPQTVKDKVTALSYVSNWTFPDSTPTDRRRDKPSPTKPLPGTPPSVKPPR